MEKKSASISRTQHQYLMLIFKWLPAVMAFSFFMNVYCAFAGVWFQVITHFLGLAITPLVFYYIASYIFHFCWYHRLFIHYIAIEELINLTDWYFRIPISNEAICYVHFTITAVFFAIAIVTFFVKRPKKKGSV